MKQILKFWDFLFEAKNLEVEEGRRVGKRVVNFLKKSGFEYRGPSYDSNILINFKTGKYDSIIPPVALGGKLYQSPQGAYCFDLNAFKEKLFGDGEISPENLDIKNIVKDTDIISELGFGYGNDERKNIKNLKGPETIGLAAFKEVPRYMYLYKLRDGANIFSRMTNTNKYYDPIKKLITYYSHLFKKDINKPKFSIDDKKENLEIKKLAPSDWINYFNKTKDGWNEKFWEALMNFLNSFGGNKQDPKLHLKLYHLVMECAKICQGNHFLVFTVICNGIGICGFTQRRGEVFIHERPEFQTLLVNRKCVEDYDIIDLLEMSSVEKATGKMKKDEWNKFIDSLQEGDLVKKKDGTVVRFPNNDLVKIDDETVRRRGTTVPSSEDYEKTNLDDDGIYQFVNKIKPGDYIKMILSIKERTLIYVWEFKSIEDKKFGKNIECEIYAKVFGEYDKKPKQKSLGLNQLKEMSQGGERSKLDVEDDLGLYNILKKFSKKRGPSSEFQTSNIKLQVFRGDLDKPLRDYVPENFPEG